MELIDVLDELGNKTDLVEEREEIYKKGLWHRSVHIWIMNSKKELLVQKRNPFKKTFPNLWAISTAGHVRSGETSIDACLRELKEELNLDVKKEELIKLFTIKREQQEEDYTLRVFDDVYLLYRDIDVNNTLLQIEELTDIKYVYYEYLEDIFKQNDKEYVPYTEEHEKLFAYLKKENREIEIL